ncbi:hypothetical protein CBL_07917 [Carabus blaptoides fortunei]
MALENPITLRRLDTPQDFFHASYNRAQRETIVPSSALDRDGSVQASGGGKKIKVKRFQCRSGDASRIYGSGTPDVQVFLWESPVQRGHWKMHQASKRASGIVIDKSMLLCRAQPHHCHSPSQAIQTCTSAVRNQSHEIRA